MGDTIYWINIEIVVFWFNILIMIIYLIYDIYIETIKSKLNRFNIQQNQNDNALMEFYSPEKTEYAWKHECGYKNYINPNHVWVVEYNDVKQVEMMKDKVRTLIKEAKE